MSGLPVTRPDRPKPAAVTDGLRSAADYARAEKAEGTRRAYRADWEHFSTWCGGAQTDPIPASAETVAAYLAALADAGLKASTITRRCAAIGYAHRLAGHEPPTQVESVRAVLRGIRRTLGTAAVRKAPAVARTIAAMVKAIPVDSLTGKRDRALLLLGFAAALRRSELAALDVGDIERVEGKGLVVHLRRSKTDQEGAGREIAIPDGRRLRPAAALEDWIAVAELSDGPLFRPIGKGGRLGASRLTDRSIAAIVKRWAGAAGLDPAMFSGHSLRAGFVTQALDDRADPFRVMDVTGHKRIETVRVYDRRNQAFRDHAGKDFL